jgi:hypothetical protein
LQPRSWSPFGSWAVEHWWSVTSPNPTLVEVTAPSGVTYPVEFEAFWDSPRNPGPLRLMATADNFGKPSVTRDFVAVPDGSFVGEITIFTLDGHDIVGFTSVAEAAGAWEAFDAPGMEYIGADAPSTPSPWRVLGWDGSTWVRRMRTAWTTCSVA